MGAFHHEVAKDGRLRRPGDALGALLFSNADGGLSVEVLPFVGGYLPREWGGAYLLVGFLPWRVFSVLLPTLWAAVRPPVDFLR